MDSLIKTYNINGFQIENVSSFVDLGVTFDPKLRFHLHIEKIVNKANCRYSGLYKAVGEGV